MKKRYLKWYLILYIFFSTSGFSADKIKPVIKEPQTPVAEAAAQYSKSVYTSEGLKRISDNMSLIDANIKDVETNLTNIDKNILTVKAEIAESKALIEEQSSLRAKLVSKMAVSQEEVAKNDAALKKLQKFSKSLEAALKKNVDMQALKMQQESAIRETAERERWSLEANGKLKRLNEMLEELGTASRQVKEKQPVLEKEIVHWRKQTVEFQTVLDNFKKQKVEFTALLSKSSATASQK